MKKFIIAKTTTSTQYYSSTGGCWSAHPSKFDNLSAALRVAKAALGSGLIEGALGEDIIIQQIEEA